VTGQFVCGNKECNEKGDLGSYEVRRNEQIIRL